MEGAIFIFKLSNIVTLYIITFFCDVEALK